MVNTFTQEQAQTIVSKLETVLKELGEGLRVQEQSIEFTHKANRPSAKLNTGRAYARL